MIRTLTSHLRSNLVGYVALFIALTHRLSADLDRPENIAKNAVLRHIKKGNVKASDISANAVSSAKVANGSLLSEDFAPGQLSAGGGPASQNGSSDSPQQVLDKVKQVDGSGSGLDSDRFDGSDSVDFAKKVADITLTDFNFGGIEAGRCVTLSSGLTGPQPGDFVLATVTNGDSLPGESPSPGPAFPTRPPPPRSMSTHRREHRRPGARHPAGRDPVLTKGDSASRHRTGWVRTP